MNGGLVRGEALQKDLAGGIEIDVGLDDLTKRKARGGAGHSRDIRDRDI